ncbi:MAG: hypothetical protein FWG71_05510 [Synergistaceae bacterium]|nr:hypothetical protein [Synergistaceae bacterium]
MSLKVCRKAALGFVVVVLMASASLANSPLVGGASSDNGSLEQEIEGGISVRADSVRYNGVKPLPAHERIGNVWHSEYHSVSVHYSITVPEDTTIRVEAQNIYDNLGNEFNRVQNVVIGGQQTKERFIVAEVPTWVEVEYRCPKGYELASSFPRANLSVNGQTLNFRNVPGKK